MSQTQLMGFSIAPETPKSTTRKAFHSAIDGVFTGEPPLGFRVRLVALLGVKSL